MESKLQKLHTKLCTCAVFRGVLEHPVFSLFGHYCSASEKGEFFKKMNFYGSFVAEIYVGGGSLTDLVQKIVFANENVYVKAAARGEAVNPYILTAAETELKIFSEFAALTAEDFAADMDISVEEIPAFDSFDADMGALYENRLNNIQRHGYGIFSSYGMFRLSDDKQIEPILSADKIGMSSFIGYEDERNKVIENTKAFLENRPAANTLLCGDAGTGKSSTVKAVANTFFDEGLRLIELRKDQLKWLPYVMGRISDNPLKFIIFIDDLSFNQNDDNFSMLKAALEGSASAKAENAVIYATSNRRHIIKESFGDREGDDVHRNDTLQETLSLSERFGLTVLFSRPSKQLYLEIVHQLAQRYGIAVTQDLDVQAEAFAIKKGNRSARGAEQFIDSLR